MRAWHRFSDQRDLVQERERDGTVDGCRRGRTAKALNGSGGDSRIQGQGECEEWHNRIVNRLYVIDTRFAELLLMALAVLGRGSVVIRVGALTTGFQFRRANVRAVQSARAKPDALHKHKE